MSTDKLDLIRELEYLDNFENLGDTLIKWSKKSDNKELKDCKKYLSEIGMYVAVLEMNIKTARIAVRDYQNRSMVYRNKYFDMKKQLEETKNQNKKMKDELIENFKKI